MKNKKLIALLAAAAILITTTGCKGGENSSESDSASTGALTSAVTSEAAEESSQPDSGESTAPESTKSVLDEGYAEPNTPIASSSKEGSNPVTFEEFLKEYKYYTVSQGYTSDTDASLADELTERRESLANYLINTKIIADKFSESFPEGFTEEEQAKIQSDYEQSIQGMMDALSESISSMAATELSEEELKAQTDKAFEEFLISCGLTREDFLAWTTIAAKQAKLTDFLTADISTDKSEAEEQMKAAAENAKAAYESDPATYDADSGSIFFIPEGSRYMQFALVQLPEEDITSILALRTDGKDDEADALRDEKLAAITEKLDSVMSRAQSGESFEDIITELNGDVGSTSEFLVVPNTGLYLSGVAECAMGIPEVGGVDSCATDVGYYVIKYTREAVFTEENYNATLEYLQNYLTKSKKSQAFSGMVKEWRDEYNYTIDRELLLLGAE